MLYEHPFEDLASLLKIQASRLSVNLTKADLTHAVVSYSVQNKTFLAAESERQGLSGASITLARSRPECVSNYRQLYNISMCEICS